MGDWGRFVGRIVEDVVNDKASANDNGLLSKAKRKVRAKAIGSVTRVSIDAVDSLAKPVQKAAAVKITQMTDKMMGIANEGESLSDSYAGTKLLMCENKKHKNWFLIYSLGYELRYQVRTPPLSRTTVIADASGKSLALIKRKRFAFRFPWSMQIDPIDFVVQIEGQNSGIVKTHYKGMKRVVRTTMNDWTIRGNFWGTNYQIVSDEGVIATVTETTGRTETHYVVSCVNLDNLLMILTLMIISQKTK